MMIDGINQTGPSIFNKRTLLTTTISGWDVTYPGHPGFSHGNPGARCSARRGRAAAGALWRAAGGWPSNDAGVMWKADDQDLSMAISGS